MQMDWVFKHMEYVHEYEMWNRAEIIGCKEFSYETVVLR